MSFRDFDKRMRKYEENIDQYILQDMYVVVRLDGRSFTKLTKDKCKFEAPFDEHFRDLMILTTEAAMKAGFDVIYGYTQSDEISLLLHPNDHTFNRKVRKINSTFAAEASVAFSMALGLPATFDCRVIPLPTKEKVADYFVWRQVDASRNALNGYCYWTMRQDGMTKREATKTLMHQGESFKNELLFEHGINYNNVPAWQKRGIGLYFNVEEKIGFNPVTNEEVITTRRKLVKEMELPMYDEYRAFIMNILEKAEKAG